MPQPYNGLEIFITVGGKTYTAQELKISEMSVTDSDEGDNEIELTIPDNDFTVTDAAVFKAGALMSIQWGYSNSKLSQVRANYVIQKPGTTYDESGVVAKVTASTKSGSLAARRPQKVMGKTSVSAVVSDVAKRNGLTLKITGGTEQLSGWAQGAWSDRDVVRILADRFGYQATYSSDTLTFAPRDYGAAPTIALFWKQGEKSNILSGDLEVDSKKAMGDAKTTAVSVDPATKTVKTATSDQAAKTLAVSADDGNSWATQMQQAQAAVDATSPKVPAFLSFLVPGSFGGPSSTPMFPGAGPSDDFVKAMSSPDPSADNLKSLASGELQAKQKKKGDLSVTSTGFLQATARIIVNITGFAKRDSGNWYTCSVEHNISMDAGYKCKWELARHGSNTKGTEKNTSPLNNQKPGGADVKTKKAVAINANTGGQK